MFSRVFAVALATLPIMTLAAPQLGGGDAGGQCNVGQLSCCNQVQDISGLVGANAGGLLGIPINVPLLLGINCNPISVIGVGGNSCAAQPVCCQGNIFPGLVNVLNCSPVNVNL